MSRRGALRSRGLSLALRVLPWFGCDDAQEPGTSRSDAQEPGTSPSDARAGNDATRQDARPDAARRDAGSSDIATADASPRDASPRDAGSSDIATADASARDASRPDAWKPDASQRDASQPDASQPDAAPPDAAPPDAALPDAALPDAALPDAGPAPIEWAACPLHSDVAGDEAECATVRRPLQTGVPGSPSIDVWVKRVRNGEDLGQIWLLQGGPGASVTDFDTRLRDFQAQ